MPAKNARGIERNEVGRRLFAGAFSMFLAIAGLTGAALADWWVPLSVKVAGNPFADMGLGMKAGATNNFDQGTDTLCPPPGPNGEIACFASISDEPGVLNKLLKDCRGVSQDGATWQLFMNAAAKKPMSVGWNPGSLPAGWKFTRQAANGGWEGTGPETDMRTAPFSLDVTGGSARFLIKATPGGDRLTLDVQSSPMTGIKIAGSPAGVTNYVSELDNYAAVTLTAPATAQDGDAKYDFVRWTINGTAQPDARRTIAFNITENMTFVASYAPVKVEKRTLNVQSSPMTGIKIAGSPAGVTNYVLELDNNTAVTLTAPATAQDGDAKYDFVRWTINGAAQPDAKRTIAFNIAENTTVVASYAPAKAQKWKLTVQSSPITGINTTGTPAGVTNYVAELDKNTAVTLNAPTGDAKYTFVRWTLNGADQPDNMLTLGFNIKEDSTAVAIYAQFRTLRVRSDPELKVSIKGTPPIAGGLTQYGTGSLDNFAVTLEAPSTTWTDHRLPENIEYRFIRWTLNGADQPDGVTTLSFNIKEDSDAVATYAPVKTAEKRTLSVQSAPKTAVNIAGTPAGVTNYVSQLDHGSTVTLTAPETLPDGDDKFVFVRWDISPDPSEGSMNPTITFPITADTTAVAFYQLVKAGQLKLSMQSTTITPVNITGTHGGMTPCVSYLDNGSAVTLTAPETAELYGQRLAFVRWTINGAPQPEANRTIAFNIAADTTVVASYAPSKAGKKILTVLSTPRAGINVAGAPAGVTEYGALCEERSTVTLTASAFAAAADGTNYIFAHWTINGAAQPELQTTITFRITEDTTALATYAPTARKVLNVQSSPIAGIAITGAPAAATNYIVQCDDGAAVELAAPAVATSEGNIYTFARWTVNGTAQPELKTNIAFKIGGNTVAVAQYATGDRRTLRVQSTPVSSVAITGNVPGVSNYEMQLSDDFSVTLNAPRKIPKFEKRAVPAVRPYYFARWTLNGIAQPGGADALSFNIKEDSTAVATYKRVRYLVITGPARLFSGAASEYSCKAHYSDGSSGVVTARTQWSEDSSAAKFIRAGKLTTDPFAKLMAGVGGRPLQTKCRITAKYGGKSGRLSVKFAEG